MSVQKVWELKAGSVNDFAPLVFASERDAVSGMFDVSGAPLAWAKNPKVEVLVEPGKKKPKPQADISALTPGALALNGKAKAALEPFLGRFGQFLELDYDGQPRWFYNGRGAARAGGTRPWPDRYRGRLRRSSVRSCSGRYRPCGTVRSDSF